MPRVKAVLRASKKNAQGTCPVYLRIADGERSVYRALGIRVKPADWNRLEGRVRKSHEHVDDLNAVIADAVAEAEGKAARLRAVGESPTATRLKEALLPAQRARDLHAFAEAVAADHEARGSFQRAGKVRTVSKKLRAFAGPTLPFDRLTPALLRAFETHLLAKNAPNTVRANLAALRAVYYRAIREGQAEQAANPFFSFKPVRGTAPQRAKLTLEEVRAIERLELAAGSLTWRVRAYFLFAFYGAGIRFGDLAHLTHGDVQAEGGGHLRLTYRMGKTGALKAVLLLPPARAILEAFPPRPSSPFLFPILDGYDLSTPRKVRSAVSAQTALANKYLKKVAAAAEVKCRLSTHVARHSFADIARAGGWDVYAISKALGHANLRVTEHYLRGFDAAALDAKMQDLLS